MTRYNDKLWIIGVDMGYGNMKTASCHFPTGLEVYESEPSFTGDHLEFEGKHYKIGEGHKFFIADKTLDNDYYILTLAAIAKECQANNVYKGNIYLAVGLPVSWITEQRDQLRNYIMQNTKLKFTFNSKAFNLTLKGCDIYPQGYPALVSRFKDMSGSAMVADIGCGTLNIICANGKIVDEQKCYTEKLGVEQFKIAAKNAVLAKFGKILDTHILEDFIRDGKADIPECYIELLSSVAGKYVESVMNALYRYEYEPDFMKLYVVGGGECLLRRYGKLNTDRVTFISDICAAAKGFEYGANVHMLLEETKKKKRADAS